MVEQSPPNTPRGVRLQRDTVSVSKNFGSMNIEIEPSQILDCMLQAIGKYKLLQFRPRPILVNYKLQCAIDASSILANRTSLKSPVFITWSITNWTKNWINLVEGKVGTHTGWSWLKAIKINSRNCTLYLNNKAYGKVVNSQFQHSTYSPPNPTNKPMDVQERLISL